jgi:probable rRNA maturation factor
MIRTPRGAALPVAEGDLIENHQKAIRVDVRSLSNFLRQVRRQLHLEKHGVGVRFISDSAMTHLNQTYRKKKGTTDVLSFPDAEQATDRGVASTKKRAKPRGAYLGDIAISPNVARRNAKSSGHALPHELRILILHGVLHLLGYDHETDQGQMDRIEAKLRRRMGLA